MKKNGWIVIIVTLIALLLPAAGIQIALHGKTVPLDKGQQKTVMDGTQSGEAGNGVQTDVSENGAQTDTAPEEPTPAPVTEEQKAYYLPAVTRFLMVHRCVCLRQTEPAGAAIIH